MFKVVLKSSLKIECPTTFFVISEAATHRVPRSQIRVAIHNNQAAVYLIFRRKKKW